VDGQYAKAHLGSSFSEDYLRRAAAWEVERKAGLATWIGDVLAVGEKVVFLLHET